MQADAFAGENNMINKINEKNKKWIIHDVSLL